MGWALAIYQYLANAGYDVFFDFTGLGSGNFERVIIENIEARAHFLVLLTPSALEPCGDPKDWLRREIETALTTRRNIIPVTVEGFDFNAPGVAKQLKDKLADLKTYNALAVPDGYFESAMQRLCDKFLNIPLDAVLHSASTYARQVANKEQLAASAARQARPPEMLTVTSKAVAAEPGAEPAATKRMEVGFLALKQAAAKRALAAAKRTLATVPHAAWRACLGGPLYESEVYVLGALLTALMLAVTWWIHKTGHDTIASIVFFVSILAVTSWFWGWR